MSAYRSVFAAVSVSVPVPTKAFAEMGSAAGREIGEMALRTMDENESGAIYLGTPKSCAMSADFRRADLGEDALLTETEFLQGFPIMVAMRAAIRPDL